KQIKTDYQQNPVLISYVKALGFTLAKIELGVWKLYLEQSQIDKKLKSKVYKQFVEELAATKEFFSEITGKKSYLWFRPWLQQSIDLRSSMIHPLNLCQLESLRRKDHDLLRTSVTGIACGMLTTG
ncbi:MAG: phosphoenolpyruvate carboxylase, partial [Halobacteriovoraceae bacterium]|nr:phosphoenolpyruvate carboxylase [Halobacteriovoraceae bacterium]